MADEMSMRSWGGLSPYESFMVAEKSSKRASGTAIAGITVASVAAALGIGAWIFGPIFANAKAKGVETLALANQRNTDNTIDRLAGLLAAERNERVAQGLSVTQTINDTISGQQTSTLTAQQASELSSIQSLQNTLLSDAVTGRSSLNPTPVTIYSAPAPCSCPCNG